MGTWILLIRSRIDFGGRGTKTGFMFESRFARIGLLWILMTGLVLAPKCQAQDFTRLTCTVSELPDGAYNLFVFEQYLVGPDGPIPETNTYQGPLVAITNRGANVPFQILIQNSNLSIYQASPVTPLDSVGETFTFYDGNVATNLYVALDPVFQTQPQSQSLFVGSNGSFTAQAWHCTGYQWQQDGTNLVEDGHFSGVTNSVLNITGVSTNDAGTYTVIAEHPSEPLASSDAVLAVFKPIELSFADAAPPGFVRILAGNADQSPFEAWRASNVDFYFSADLSLSFTNWVLCTNAVVLTNGVLRFDFSTAGMVSGFWRTVEQP
jgi:hypothetical protein